jgi:hypothetical protein
MYSVLFTYKEGYWWQVIVHFMFSIVASIVFYTLYMMQEGKCSSGSKLTILMFVYRKVYSTLNISAVYKLLIHFLLLYIIMYILVYSPVSSSA